MILTKINIDELKLAETDNAPKLYQPPIKTQVSVDVTQILGVSETEKDPIFCRKYGVESYFRIWFKNGLSWYVDGSLESCHYEELLMRLNN